jgi:hypothetical protein
MRGFVICCFRGRRNSENCIERCLLGRSFGGLFGWSLGVLRYRWNRCFFEWRRWRFYSLWAGVGVFLQFLFRWSRLSFRLCRLEFLGYVLRRFKVSLRLGWRRELGLIGCAIALLGKCFLFGLRGGVETCSATSGCSMDRICQGLTRCRLARPNRSQEIWIEKSQS